MLAHATWLPILHLLRLNPTFQGRNSARTGHGLSGDDRAVKGKEYNILIYAFSGIKGDIYNFADNEKEVKLFLELKTIQPLIENFYYNLSVPLQLLYQLPENSTEYIKILNILNTTVNMVDLRIAHSKELYDSVYAANNFLSEQLYSKINGLDAVISFIGHIVQNDGCNEVSVGQLRFYMLLFLEVLDLKTGSVYGNFV